MIHDAFLQYHKPTGTFVKDLLWRSPILRWTKYFKYILATFGNFVLKSTHGWKHFAQVCMNQVLNDLRQGNLIIMDKK